MTRTAIAYYIVSWQYRIPWEYEHEKEKINDEIMWLDKSISTYMDIISPKAYIDEYITGTRLSDINLKSLKEDSGEVR